MADFVLPMFAQFKGIKAVNGGTPSADAARVQQYTLGPPGGEIFLVPAIGQRIKSVSFLTDTGVYAIADVASNSWIFWESGGAGTAVVSGPQGPEIIVYNESLRLPAFTVEDPSPLATALAGATTFTVTVSLQDPEQAVASPGETIFTGFQKNVAQYSPDLTSLLVDLDSRFRTRGGSYLTPSGVTVNYAGAGFLAPGAITWVSPTDIGGGADQLPPDPVNLTADHLENHPSCFFRGTDSFRAVGSLYSEQEFSDVEPLSQGVPLVDEIGPGVIQVNAQPLVIDTPPTYTDWTVVLDGVVYRGWFQVPNGNPDGLIRPRDLFQAIFGKALGNDGPNPTFIYLPSPGQGDDPVDFVAQQLIRDWSHLTYARIHGYGNEQGTIIGTPVYSNEEEPPA